MRAIVTTIYMAIITLICCLIPFFGCASHLLLLEHTSANDYCGLLQLLAEFLGQVGLDVSHVPRSAGP